jgi:hypothetical protein
MGLIVLPKTLVAGTDALADDVMDDLEAIVAMVNGGLDAANLENGAVTTAKIADDAVTAAKLADDAVPAAAIPNTSIPYAKMQAMTGEGFMTANAFTLNATAIVASQVGSYTVVPTVAGFVANVTTGALPSGDYLILCRYELFGDDGASGDAPEMTIRDDDGNTHAFSLVGAQATGVESRTSGMMFAYVTSDGTNSFALYYSGTGGDATQTVERGRIFAMKINA